MQHNTRFLIITLLLLCIGFTSAGVVIYVAVYAVGQPPYSDAGVRTALWTNVLVNGAVAAAVMGLAYGTLGTYQRLLALKANADPLTGTVSRHGLEPLIENRLRLANRNQQTFAIVLLNVDHFKKINDQYGYAHGDKALLGLANILQNNSRGSDVICRWGGEEFLVLLPDCAQRSAIKIAEKLRNVIQDELKTVDGKRVDITASFGVAQYNGDESIDDLFTRVSDALYRAKQGGRNKVCASTTV